MYGTVTINIICLKYQKGFVKKTTFLLNSVMKKKLLLNSVMKATASGFVLPDFSALVQLVFNGPFDFECCCCSHSGQLAKVNHYRRR
jgi:hypothetical protein